MIMRFVWHLLVLALGLYILTVLPLGISYHETSDLFWAALVLIIANAIIKPILVFITLPLVLLSLGLFLLVINAVILLFLPHFVSGFHVHGFWSAFFGSIILSLITGLFSSFGKSAPRRRDSNSGSGKVIDI
jgi:putative membrane protein